MDEDLLTAPQVAKILGVTSASINKWCKEGLFPHAYRLNPTRKSPWRIPRRDIELFKQKRREQYGWMYFPVTEKSTDEAAVLN